MGRVLGGGGRSGATPASLRVRFSKSLPSLIISQSARGGGGGGVGGGEVWRSFCCLSSSVATSLFVSLSLFPLSFSPFPAPLLDSVMRFDLKQHKQA